MTIFVYAHTLSNFCVSSISHRAAHSHSHTHLYDSQQCTDGHPTSIHCRECKTNHEYYYCKLNGSLTLVYFCGKNPKLNAYTFFLVAIIIGFRSGKGQIHFTLSICTFMKHYLYSWQFTEYVQETMRNTTAMVMNRYCAENYEACRQTVPIARTR